MAVQLAVHPDLDLGIGIRQRDDRLFRQIAAVLLVALLALSILIPLIDVPEPAREQARQLPPQLAKVMLEKRKAEQPKPKPEPKKEEPKPEQVKPEEKPKPKPVVKPKTVKEAQQKAKQSGLLALQDDLAAMRDSVDVSSLKQTQLSRGPGTAAKTERALIAGRAAKGSGGIQTGTLSSNVGGSELASRSQTVVEASAEQQAELAKQSRKGSGSAAGRNEESLRMTLEQAKGSLYTLYNRALRKDPTLEGKVVFELVIEADGSVSACKIVSSELVDKKLESKLVSRLRLLNFGADKVAQTKTRWAIDFLPL